MKLKLILPRQKKSGNAREQWDGRFSAFVLGIRKYPYANLALPIIAALTPPDIEVNIIDESIESIDYDEKMDMVGITAPTFLVNRVYEIADKFRKRGVAVVLGGHHPSMLPEEAIQHSDSVVIGEAENVWSRLIDDFKKGKLMKFYHSSKEVNITKQPIPRWDLLKNELYRFHLLQTTRGCPHDCEFCSVKAFFGNKYKCKPVENVVREIEVLLNYGKKRIFFVDDNFIGSKNHTKNLIRAIMPFKLKYVMETSINIAEDRDFLGLLAESGCEKIFIGIESISQKTISHMNKGFTNDVDKYLKNIELIQSRGIAVYGSFILGNDTDDESVFENTVNFINDSNMESAVFHIITPFPGTKLYYRLEKEGRILHKDWSRYDAHHVCIKPKLMSPEALQNGYIWANQQVYSYESIFKRLEGLWNLWNKTKVRYDDRVSPIIINLSGNDKAYEYPLAVNPKYFNLHTPLKYGYLS